MAKNQPPTSKTVYSDSTVDAAWGWLRTAVSTRPTAVSGECVFDHKAWAIAPQGPLRADNSACAHLACLFAASAFCSIDSLNALGNQGPAPTVQVTLPLDDQIKGIVTTPKRFRASFAEHLAFWIRMADAAKAGGAKFALAQPNLLPEDKGHDGLLMTSGALPMIEIQSVKNSINSPRSLVASAAFRKKAKPKKKKQLDDFWMLTHKNVGMVRLHRMISQVAASLALTGTDKLKSGIVAAASYNAVVVANDQYATHEMFNGYQHIVGDVQRRFATYVGARTWVVVARTVAKQLREVLKQNGAM